MISVCSCQNDISLGLFRRIRKNDAVAIRVGVQEKFTIYRMLDAVTKRLMVSYLLQLSGGICACGHTKDKLWGSVEGIFFFYSPITEEANFYVNPISAQNGRTSDHPKASRPKRPWTLRAMMSGSLRLVTFGSLEYLLAHPVRCLTAKLSRQ